MLLFTLLTTLLLGSPGAPAKDTLPVVKPRPFIGLFYMTGPRALSSQGFIGLTTVIPFAEDMWNASLGVGGYANYSETGYRTIPYGSHISGNEAIPVTYSRTYGWVFTAGVERVVSIAPKLKLGIGVRSGFADLWSREEYKTLPQQDKPCYWPDEILPIYSFYSFFETHSARQIWVMPSMSFGYEITKRIHASISIQDGPHTRLERRHGGGQNYIIKGPYSPIVNGVYDPYNEVYAPIKKSGIPGDFNFAQLPTLNRFTLFGSPFLTFSVLFTV